MRSVVLPIIILNIIAFVLQLMLDGFAELFILHSGLLILQPWRLVTSMFLHGGAAHLFFNMYVLLMFGPLVEQRIGPKRFLMIYFTAGIAAGLLSAILYPLIFGTPFIALGASGAIMGIIGVIIVLIPNLKILLFFAIPMQLRYAAFIIAALDIFGIFYQPGVANIAHLIGLVCGLFYAMSLKKKSKKVHKKIQGKSHLDEDDFKEYMRTGRI